MKSNNISVVIPVYNAESFIEKTLDAILEQTKYELIKEIIIVNDGSKDNTKNVIEKYKEQKNNDKIIIIDQINKGVSEARNTGITKSTSEWIALCDADDLWDRKKIERQNDIIEKNKNISFLGTGLHGYNPRVGTNVCGNLYCISLQQLLRKTWPQTSTVILKKELFEKVGGFPIGQNHSEDFSFWLGCAYFTELYYIQEELVKYSGGKALNSSTGLSNDILKMHLGVQKSLRDAYNKKYISYCTYIIYRQFEKIKYLRRKMLVLKNTN